MESAFMGHLVFVWDTAGSRDTARSHLAGVHDRVVT